LIFHYACLDHELFLVLFQVPALVTFWDRRELISLLRFSSGCKKMPTSIISDAGHHSDFPHIVVIEDVATRL